MKKMLLFVVLPLLFVISSCSKKSDLISHEDKGQKLYSVTLAVDGFSSTTVPMSTATVSGTVTEATAIPDVTLIRYLIYNSNNVLVKDTSQTSHDPRFGTLNTSLAPGDYKVHVLAAALNSIGVLQVESGTSVALGSTSNMLWDYFKKTIDVKVTGLTQVPVISLDRVVGKMEIKITDAVPANVSKVLISYSSGSWLYLNNSTEPPIETQVFSRLFKDYEAGTVNDVYSLYAFPTTSGSITTDVTLDVYDLSNVLIITKTIKNVLIEKNKKTLLTGKLYTQPISSGVSVTVNTDWNVATNVVNF